MKMKRPHTIPLTPQSSTLLNVLKPISGRRDFLFPGHRDPKTHANSQAVNMAIKRMGFEGQLVSHGLRALANTMLNEEEFDSDITY